MLMESQTAARDARLSTPLGLIRARRLIAEAEYQAGLEFEKCWIAFVMPENPRSCLLHTVPGAAGGASEYDERRYRQACNALATAGLRAYHQVINVIGYKHWPRFLDTETRRTAAAWDADKRDLNALRDGLAALAAKFHKSSDPDDKTVESEDSVAAISELRNARLAHEAAEPSTPRQRYQAVTDMLISRQRRARLERNNE